MRSSFGVALRAVGGNERSVERAGWSVLGLRAGTYALAGFFADSAPLRMTSRAFRHCLCRYCDAQNDVKCTYL